MKLTLFFLVKNQNGEILDNPIFFAYTDNENLKKNFIKTRNMELFKEKEVSISRDEFIQFEKDRSHHRLIRASYISKDSDDDYIGRVTVSFASTDAEEKLAYIQSDKIFGYISKHTFDPVIFKNKYLKALCSMNFSDMFLYKAELSPIYKECPFDVGIQMDYKNIHVDTFSIFMDTSGYTMMPLK